MTSWLISAAVTFVLLPIAHGSTVNWVQTFTYQAYGLELVAAATLAWMGILALLIFSVTRLLLALLTGAAGLAVLMWLFDRKDQ